MDPPCRDTHARRHRGARALLDQRGFTLVEVLIAILVFSAAVLGSLALINAANLTALSNKARAGGVNLARQIQEGARGAGSSVTYGQLQDGCPSPSSLSNPCATTSPIVAALQSQPGLATDASSPAGEWQVTRDGVEYSVKVAVCTMDDPADGLGSHAGGGYCSGASSGSADSDADDYKRVSIQVDWGQTRGTNTIRAVALINSSGVNGPGVTCLRQTGSSCPNAPVITNSSTTEMSFTASLSGTPVSLDWSVDGSYKGTVTPSGGTATFTWTLGTVADAGAVADGTYSISAVAFDENGNAGNVGTVQVQINRRAPAAPDTFMAGRNDELVGNGDIGGVDLDWLPSTDKDILYYRIYSKSGTSGTPVLEHQTQDASQTTWTDMTIAALPTYGDPYAWPDDCEPFPVDPTPVFYWAVAVDQNGSTVREGTPSPQIDVNACNHRPKTVGGFSKTANNDGTVTFDWDTPSSPVDPDVPAGDSIYGYRIYRWDESDHASSVPPNDRYEYLIPPYVTSCVAGSGTKPWPCWTDTVPRPNGVALAYCVRAVDEHMQESDSCSNKQTF